MLRILKTAALLLLVTFSTSLSAQRVLGYLPDYRNPSTIQFNKLTDVAFSFMNPDVNGNIIQINTGSNLYSWNSTRFTQTKNAAQANGVNLWIAIGGADDHEQRAERLRVVSANPTSRTKFAKQLLDFSNNNGAVGVIVDWEFPKTANARAAHLELMKALDAYRDSNYPNMKIGIAVGGEYTNSVNHLQYVDPSFFSTNAGLIDEWHIMAYDFPISYGVHHSSLNDGKKAADAWKAKGVPAAKMLLAIPFYGRNTSRTAINYNQLTGNAATNYNADQAGGYYYNGKPTIEAKIDHIINIGGAGIVIWDVGQDRTDQYSLLSAVDAKMQTLCPIPNPNLGPDQGVCNGQNVTLDSKVATASGRTFSWKKDGNAIAGSGPTLVASAAGDYEVTVTQGSCSKKDLIKVVSGSSVTATGGSACWNENVVLTVNNVKAGKQYDWYDAAVGGTQVASGATTYTYTPGTAANVGTRSFYVEERASGTVSHNLLQTNIHANYSWNAGQGKRAILIDAKKALTLKSVRVFTKKDSETKFKIKLLRASDNVGVDSTPVQTVAAIPGGQAWENTQTDVNLNFTAPTGEYFLVFQLEAGTAGDHSIVFGGGMDVAPSVNTVANVITIAKFMFTDFGNGFLKNQQTEPSWAGYGCFYNLRIEVGASTSCGRAKADAVVQNCAVGIDELFEAVGIKLYPNPSGNNFTIQPGDIVKGEYTVNVININGEVVYTTTSSAASVSFGEDFAEGVYSVQLVAAERAYITKVVKQ